MCHIPNKTHQETENKAWCCFTAKILLVLCKDRSRECLENLFTSLAQSYKHYGIMGVVVISLLAPVGV